MIKLFWLMLSLGCVGWYLMVLGLVAVKGGRDIKDLLTKLSAGKPTEDAEHQTGTTEPTGMN